MAPAELARTAYTVECFLNALRLDAEPVCAECELLLTDSPPKQEADDFLRRLDAALRDQCWPAR